MPIRPVPARPPDYAERARLETIVLAAGWSTALAALFVRLVGIG